MQEKEEADKQRRMAEEAYVAAVIARDQRVQDLEKMEKMCKKQLQDACQRFNKALVYFLNKFYFEINRESFQIFY